MSDADWPELPEDERPDEVSLELPEDDFPYEVSLGLPDEHVVDERVEQLADDPAEGSGGPPEEPPAPYDEIVLELADADAGSLAIQGHALADAFGVSQSAYDGVAARLGLPAAIDSHSAAVVLGELGLDAAVQHGDLDGLAAAVAAGEEVVLTGPQGPITVTDVQPGHVELTDHDGGTSHVALAEFEAAWEQASYAMVVAEPEFAPGEVVLTTGARTVLGLSWPQT